MRTDITEFSSEEKILTISPTKEENPAHIYSPRQRLLLTLCISFSFCTSAKQLNMTGQTPLHMGYLLKTDIAVISYTRLLLNGLATLLVVN